MKISDYVVNFLVEHGVKHAFGYPGGMVTHLMDSFDKYADRIQAHVSYHEQGAAFEACGYAQASGGLGVAYATSGPGATNLITGIADAFFDSIPVLFITCQVNTNEMKGSLSVRQRGFQETDIVSIVKPITKYAVCVTDENRIRSELERAVHEATSGRKGPVLVDIPMNVFRGAVEPEQLPSFAPESTGGEEIHDFDRIAAMVSSASRPVLLLGNGIKSAGASDLAISLVPKLGIPVVATMLTVDIVNGMDNGYGFIGAYGSRAANFIIAKSDLVISVGARLDVRQVGARRENFAPGAKLLRFDIDKGELEYRVHNDEVQVCADAEAALSMLDRAFSLQTAHYDEWMEVCNTIRSKLLGNDTKACNLLVERISEYVPEAAQIVTDVGQNQVWVAQSFKFKRGQRNFTSGGHGAMGYSLPAAIGCYYATGKPTYSFNGDGGFQMNLQELEVIARDKLPIKIVIFNNHALGMIRHFQEMYFESRYAQTTEHGGYAVPNFAGIAAAYGMPYYRIDSVEHIPCAFTESKAGIFEVDIKENTYVFPKLEFGKPNQDQEPLLDRALYEEIMAL